VSRATTVGRVRILIESPNCNAFGGSNAGVGHGWVTHLARTHEVHVVVYGPLYDGGHDGGRAPEIPGVHPIRIEPTRARRLGTMTDYVLAARKQRDAIIARVKPDLLHSIEPGGWLGPRVFVTDRIPSVMGPLNGGASLAPRAFAEAVLRELPVSQAKAFFSGGPRKVAVTLVNEALFGNIGTSKLLAHRAMKRARRILLATELSSDAIPAGCAGRVRRVPLSGFDLDTFTPAPKPDGPMRVLYAGRVVPAKGLHLIIEALPRSGANLRIAGGIGAEDTWYQDHCRLRAEQLGVADRVTWLGPLPRDALAQEYSAAGVFCMLSLWEPFGMTYVEAMAAGTAVIGLASGGATEIVTDATGWLVRPTTPRGVIEELGALLARLEQDRAALRDAGAAARAHAQETYSWPRALARLEEVYAEIV